MQPVRHDLHPVVCVSCRWRSVVVVGPLLSWSGWTVAAPASQHSTGHAIVTLQVLLLCVLLSAPHTASSLGPSAECPVATSGDHWCAPVGPPLWHSCCQWTDPLGFGFVVLCSCPCVLCGGLLACCGLCVVLVCVCCVGVGTHTHACLQARLLATGTRGISVSSLICIVVGTAVVHHC